MTAVSKTVEVTQDYHRKWAEQWSDEGQNAVADALAQFERDVIDRHRLNATPSRQDGLREALEKIRQIEPEELWGIPDRYSDERPSHQTLDADEVFGIIDAALSDTPPPDNEETEALRGLLTEARETLVALNRCARRLGSELLINVDTGRTPTDLINDIDAKLTAFNNGGK